MVDSSWSFSHDFIIIITPLIIGNGLTLTNRATYWPWMDSGICEYVIFQRMYMALLSWPSTCMNKLNSNQILTWFLFRPLLHGNSDVLERFSRQLEQHPGSLGTATHRKVGQLVIYHDLSLSRPGQVRETHALVDLKQQWIYAASITQAFLLPPAAGGGWVENDQSLCQTRLQSMTVVFQWLFFCEGEDLERG